MKALVTGATGFVGRRLLGSLESPRILCRDPERARRELGEVEAFAWDALAGPPPAEAFEGVEAVFHLAGEPILGRRWNRRFKERLRDSRVLGTQNLVAAMAELDQPPRVMVSASAIGYYGSRGEDELSETAPPGKGFLPELCRDWEAASTSAEAHGVRVVPVRIGVVLGLGGGALQEMLTPFKLGVGGPVASGRQWMSWIHAADLVALLCHAARSEAARTPWNGVGPVPVRNKEFARILGSVLHRPAVVPVPLFAIRLRFGEVADHLVESVRAVPTEPLKHGFEYRFPDLEGALKDLLEPS